VSIDRHVAALFAGALLVAQNAPNPPQRQAMEGRFTVPNVRATATPTGMPAGVITNGSFESGKIDDGWYQCGDVSAYTTTLHPRGGTFSEYSGTIGGSGEPAGNSGVCQAIVIPPGGVLTAQLYQLSNERDTSFAYQEADLLDDRGNVVVNLYKTVNYKPAWVKGTWNLGAYAGRRYWLYFGVHGDGYAKLSTQQFLDGVTLTGSSSPPPE
jgi:hypothetical protein